MRRPPRSTLSSSSAASDVYKRQAVPIAKALENECVGYAVATAWEGHNLRRHGIDKPLYILGVVPENLCDLVINEEMLPPIFTYKMAKAFSDHAVKLNKTVKFNIAVDTGMSRIGYLSLIHISEPTRRTPISYAVFCLKKKKKKKNTARTVRQETTEKHII